jgi:hypothetical protein
VPAIWQPQRLNSSAGLTAAGWQREPNLTAIADAKFRRDALLGLDRCVVIDDTNPISA